MHISNKLKPFNYFGAKFSYLPWLLPLLPACRHFVDVFGGSGCVLLNREKSDIETYNDINGKLVNFFLQLRDNGQELIDKLRLTPYSRQEYMNAVYIETDTDIEKARKFFVRCQQSMWSMGVQQSSKGWASDIRECRAGVGGRLGRFLNHIDKLKYCVERLRTVQIENMDFRHIMDRYNYEDVFFYLDSPYDPTFRSMTDKYEFDFVNQDFYDLHYYCRHSKAKFAVSAYNSPFMLDLFRDFNVTMGPNRKSGDEDSRSETCEVLFTNY